MGSRMRLNGSPKKDLFMPWNLERNLCRWNQLTDPDFSEGALSLGRVLITEMRRQRHRGDLGLLASKAGNHFPL